MAMRWVKDFLSHHPKCREFERHPGSGQLPTRLIDLGQPGGIEQPRLVLTSQLQDKSDVRYVTLSQRWASSQVLELKTSNFNTLRQSIPLECLPKTFLDAIAVTRALSFRYLWIDSLCIIQDSSADWQAEAVKMGTVYQNGTLNLAATGAASVTGSKSDGLFQERDSHGVTPKKLRIQYRGHDEIYTAVTSDLWSRRVGTAALNRRGWECRAMQACETYPEGLDGWRQLDGGGSLYTEPDGSQHPRSFKNWRDQLSGKHFWADIVESVAQSLQPFLDDDYLAGLWKQDLPYNLMWRVGGIVGQTQRPEQYRCPSWSWAALDYGTALIADLLIPQQCRVKSLVLVRSVYIEPRGSSVLGLLKDGFLELRGRVGRMFPITVDRVEEVKYIDLHLSFELDIDDWAAFDLDFPPERVPDQPSIFCMPLFLCRPTPGPEGPLMAHCLLLRRIKPDGREYTRIGTLRVSLDLGYALPSEIRWIVDFGRSEVSLEDEDLVTIY
ncbi:heterokaryon incompatibility protein-domain-containing protein [Cladorrhinum sp. PSN332]|nr:heterokaryon incompatibility protein-domain-containing protein [Cladorrhinum sp. PSN332]